MEELMLDILEELKIELGLEKEKDIKLLESKLRSAKREVQSKRKYPEYYNSIWVNNDLLNYASNIKELAMFDYVTIGAEKELSHNENGTSRSYDDRNKCFSGIVPLCKVT